MDFLQHLQLQHNGRRSRAFHCFLVQKWLSPNQGCTESRQPIQKKCIVRHTWPSFQLNRKLERFCPLSPFPILNGIINQCKIFSKVDEFLREEEKMMHFLQAHIDRSCSLHILMNPYYYMNSSEFSLEKTPTLYK